MVPSQFRSLAALRRLNIAGVGLSLAALTSLALGGLFRGQNSLWIAPFVVGLPTLVVGLVWAQVLRSKRTVGKRKVRLGWWLSIPLAMLNAATAGGVLLMDQAGSHQVAGFLAGMLAGVIYGVLVWVPALLLTLLLFGLPIRWSQQQAERGLSGEERGEGLVGLAVSMLSLGAVMVLASLFWQSANSDTGVRFVTPGKWDFLVPWGKALLALYAGGGLLSGLLSCSLSLTRERRRRAIVRQAEAGEIDGLRVDETAEGKVLVRVATTHDDYRAAELEEEDLAALDVQGNTLRVLSAAPVSPGA